MVGSAEAMISCWRDEVCSEAGRLQEAAARLKPDHEHRNPEFVPVCLFAGLLCLQSHRYLVRTLVYCQLDT